jgi:hypothetical protein
LAFQHKGRYERTLAAKKKADADFKNACKAAKAEMGVGAVETIKDMVAIESEGGEDAIRSRLVRSADALRWMSIPLGTQLALTLGEPDRMPSVDRAFDEGKRASAENKPAKPPYDPSTEQYGSFMAGYSEHQAAIVRGMGRDLQP